MSQLVTREHILGHIGSGGAGFTLVERKTENGKDYIKKTGFGFGSHTHEWLELVEEK